MPRGRSVSLFFLRAKGAHHQPISHSTDRSSLRVSFRAGIRWLRGWWWHCVFFPTEKRGSNRSLNNNRVALKRPIPSGPRETRLLFCKLLFPFFCGKKGPDTPFFIPFLAGSLATVDGRGPFGPHVKPAKGKKKGVHIFFLLPSRSPQRNPLSRSFPPGVSLRSPGRREVSVGFLWGLNGRRKNEGKEKRTCPPPQRASHAGAGKDGAEVVFPFERVLRPVAAWRLGVLWGRV